MSQTHSPVNPGRRDATASATPGTASNALPRSTPIRWLTLVQAAQMLTGLGQGIVTYNRLYQLFTRQVNRPPISLQSFDLGTAATPRPTKVIDFDDLPRLAEFLGLDVAVHSSHFALSTAVPGAHQP